jgi:hypothetical protein
VRVFHGHVCVGEFRLKSALTIEAYFLWLCNRVLTTKIPDDCINSLGDEVYCALRAYMNLDTLQRTVRVTCAHLRKVPIQRVACCCRVPQMHAAHAKCAALVLADPGACSVSSNGSKETSPVIAGHPTSLSTIACPNGRYSLSSE